MDGMQMDGNCSMACMKMTMEMMNSMMTRMMTFHFSSVVPTGLLFEQWKVNSAGDLVGAIVVVFIIAILYEGLKTLREYLIYLDVKNSKRYQAVSKSYSQQSEEDKALLTVQEPLKRRKGVTYYSISISMHLVQSSLHVLQVAVGYVLMLVAMTFNVWLFLAVCFGAGVGYLLFARTRHLFNSFRESNEHCH